MEAEQEAGPPSQLDGFKDGGESEVVPSRFTRDASCTREEGL